MKTPYHIVSRTYDDVYMIMAAMLSGPNCMIVSNDAFKDHRDLDPIWRSIFLSWQRSCQVRYKSWDSKIAEWQVRHLAWWTTSILQVVLTSHKLLFLCYKFMHHPTLRINLSSLNIDLHCCLIFKML